MITIYSTEICPRCALLKAACKQVGIPYEEKPLDAEVMSEILCETDIWTRSAPVVNVGAAWYFSDDIFSASGDLVPEWEDMICGYRRPRNKGPFTGTGGQPSDKVQACKGIWGE